MYLFFDTETTGLPRSWKAPVTDLANWPRMVQLAWLQYDQTGMLIRAGNHIIKPEGFSIPLEASNIHGITTAQAMREGEELSHVLNRFAFLAGECTMLVAHNMKFDEKIVGAELLRKRMTNVLEEKKKICTMDSTTDWCALPGPYGYKWPKLEELHYKLFRTGFAGAHNAAADVEVTAKCFWELRRRGLLN